MPSREHPLSCAGESGVIMVEGEREGVYTYCKVGLHCLSKTIIRKDL